MKKTVLIASLAGALAGGLLVTELTNNRALPPAVQAQANVLSSGFAPVVKAALPAVVNVSSTRVVRRSRAGSPFGRDGSPFDDFFDFFGGPRGRTPMPPEERRSEGQGSGVIVNPEGYVLTNHHVVEDASQVTVTLSDRREFDAKVVGADAMTDIAVLKVDGRNLPSLRISDSSKAQAGDIVLAIGNPFGLKQTVTMGIISATGRGGLGIERYEDFIQTDAAINPGNSGGALINTSGQLLGINTAILSGTGGSVGVGFAIPANMAREVMDQLVKSGKVSRGFIGIIPQEITPSLARAFKLTQTTGVVIAQVEPDAPGAKAGLKPGDVITKLNGEPVVDVNSFRFGVARLGPGATAKLGIVRNGRELEIPVTLTELPLEPGERGPGGAPGERQRGALDGVDVEALTPQIARQLGVPAGTLGVVVTGVDAASEAAGAGLRRGDVIMEVNRQPVTSVTEFDRALGNARGQQVLLLVRRGEVSQFIVIEPPRR
ncbi:MAG: Do family serine endopeptidase [Acidobacteria bacterium]|nr:Do family serine endopeptidase [Acidobacteriota bacterium]